MSINRLHIALILMTLPVFSGCMKDNEWINRHQSGTLPAKGIFIVNEGNFMYGNASLSFYDPATRKVQNDLFYNTNGLPLGDVAQSMVISDNLGYIVINNSGKIYVINTSDGKYVGKITGLTSPRYIHFVNSEKAYITDLYAGQITIVNPKSYQITGVILTPGHASTEQIVQWNDFLFVSCWSFDNTILVIDTRTDAVAGEIKTGKQPGGLVIDKNNKIWTLCDGGWSKSGTTSRIPMLQRIDPVTRTIEKSFSLSADAKPSRLAINDTRDSLLFINDGIWKIGVNQETISGHPFLSTANHLYYSLAVDPKNSELYLSDAIDYMQRGVIYRYSPLGAKIDSFKTGIIPGAFCFK
ncbi:MAG: YncE family protein [Bacteroidia bacterium]|nr:YncE family protein [Bacteroidia bacterium]